MLTSTASTIFSARFLPSRPSPLSPRSSSSLNISPFTLVDTMKPIEYTESHPKSSSTYEQRALKVFTSRNPDQQRERRRSMFLKRVEQSRDDKKWEIRNDQLQRSDYINEQQQWIEQRLKSLQSQDVMSIDEYTTISSESTQNTIWDDFNEQKDLNMQEVEDFARFESMELESLISLTLSQSDARQEPTNQSNPLTYDNEDYDSLFMEFVLAETDNTTSMNIDHDFDK